MKRHSYTSHWLLPRIIILPILASSLGCRARAADSLQSTVQASELQTPVPVVFADTVKVSPNAPKPVGFSVFKVQGRKSIAELESRLGPERFADLLKINRLDKSHIRIGEVLLVPEGNTDLSNLSPFPLRLEAASRIRKLVLVSRRAQAFGAYELGKLVRWGPTSTGKKSTPTPAGLYHTNWKAKTRISSVNSSWILPWCFNLDDVEGISFHQFDLPGYPASHGCVRLLEDDAKWVFEWAEMWMLSKTERSLLAHGTPVVIFGDYSYGEKAPWKRLAEDRNAASLSVAEIEDGLRKHMPKIETQARERETLVAGLGRSADQQ